MNKEDLEQIEELELSEEDFYELEDTEDRNTIFEGVFTSVGDQAVKYKEGVDPSQIKDDGAFVVSNVDAIAASTPTVERKPRPVTRVKSTPSVDVEAMVAGAAEIDIEIDAEYHNVLHQVYEEGSTDDKFRAMYNMQLARIASKDDIFAEKTISTVELDSQTSNISEKEISAWELISDSLFNGQGKSIRNYLASVNHYEEEIASNLKDRKGFYHIGSIQFASILRKAGITSQSDIADVIDKGMGADFGFLKSRLSKEERIFVPGLVDKMESVNVAKYVANIQAEGIDSEHVHAILFEEGDLENRSFAKKLLELRSARAIQHGENSIYSRLWAASLASYFGKPMEEAQGLVLEAGTKSLKESEEVSSQIRTLSDHLIGDSARRGAKLVDDKLTIAENVMTGTPLAQIVLDAYVSEALPSTFKYSVEAATIMHDLAANTAMQTLLGSTLGVEEKAMLKELVALYGIHDKNAQNALVQTQVFPIPSEARYTQEGNSLEQVKGRKGNVLSLFETLYESAESMLMFTGESSINSEDSMSRRLFMQSLVKATRTDGDKKVNPGYKGRKMTAGESDVELAILDATAEALSFPAWLMHGSEGVLADYEAMQNFSSRNMKHDGDDEDSLFFGYEERAIATLSIAKDMQTRRSLTSYRDAVAKTVLAMSDKLGLPLDDKEDIKRKAGKLFLKKGGQADKLVDAIMAFHESHKESRYAEKDMSHGLVDADLDAVTGSKRLTDRKYLWGNLDLNASVAESIYAHLENARLKVNPGAKRTMDNVDVISGVTMYTCLDSYITDKFSDQGKDIKRPDESAEEWEKFTVATDADLKQVAQYVMARSVKIKELVQELTKTGTADIEESKYDIIRDNRMPGQMPVEVVGLSLIADKLYATVLEDGKYEADEVATVAQELKYFITDPETRDGIAGIVTRDEQGRIGAVDQSLSLMAEYMKSDAHASVMEARGYAGLKKEEKPKVEEKK